MFWEDITGLLKTFHIISLHGAEGCASDSETVTHEVEHHQRLPLFSWAGNFTHIALVNLCQVRSDLHEKYKYGTVYYLVL